MPRPHDHKNYIQAPRHREDLDFHESSQAIFHYRRPRRFDTLVIVTAIAAVLAAATLVYFRHFST